MSDVSHQVRAHAFRLALAVAPVACAAGCASGGLAEHPRFSPIALLDEETAPRITVYGDLLDLLDNVRENSALEDFLYGPAPAPSPFLRNPQGLEMLGDVLLVCDQGQFAVVGVNLSTGRIKRWNEADHMPRCPVATAVDDAGRVYVADTTWCSVLVYENDGQFVRELTPTENPNRTFRPAAVLVRDSVLYVGNVGEYRLDRYDLAADRWLEPWTPQRHGRSRFMPTGLAFAETLLVVDSFGATVHHILADGTCTSDIGRLGRGEGEFVRPKNASVTAGGLLFVTDAARQSVLVFDESDDFLTELHDVPGYWRGFTLPAGVVAIPADRAPMVCARFSKNGWPVPDVFVVVSDSLGIQSLVLFGVTTRTSEGGNVG